MTLPANIRVPLFYIDFNPNKALEGPKTLPYKALLMGQKLAAGTKNELEIFRIRFADEVLLYAAEGSQAHRIAIKWFELNKTTEAYMVLIDDLDAGTLAAGSITITGPATADGILHLLIDGVYVPVAVTDEDTETEIGDAVDVAIAAKGILPITSSNAAGIITTTAKNKGEVGNYLDVQVNFSEGQILPAGVGVTIVQTTGATGVVDIDEIIALLGDEWYHVWVSPWTDAVNMLALQTELLDRFGPIRMIDGMAAVSVRGVPATLSSYASTKNYKHITCLHSEAVPQAPEEVAASYAAKWALEGEKDSARPFQTLALSNLTAPNIADRFEWEENNGLLYDGISTFEVDANGTFRIQRSITMYQTNSFGADDPAYLNLNTMLTLMYMRWDVRNTFATKYPRAKLADDGQRLPSGQIIVTPKIAKAEFINIFKGWQEELGIAENIDQFKTDLDVVRNANDPDRLDVLMSPDLINQLRVLTGIIQFILQSPTI